MVYINIPFAVENNRIDKDVAKRELEILDISIDAKFEAFEAIYNRSTRGVNFAKQDIKQAALLENALYRLGVPYKQSEKSEY